MLLNIKYCMHGRLDLKTALTSKLTIADARTEALSWLQTTTLRIVSYFYVFHLFTLFHNENVISQEKNIQT